MNFREFEELINSGAEEITLTEDVVLDFSDEEIDMDCIEIPKLIIEGDGHSVSLNIQNMDFIFDDECIFKNIKLDSCNNLKITWMGFVKLENSTFKNFELIAQESLHICNCNFKDCTKLINESIIHAKNSKIYKFINSGEAYFKNSRLFGLSNAYGGDVQLKNCKLSYSVNEGKLILCDCNIVDSLNNFSKNLKIINCHFEDIVSVKDGGAIRRIKCLNTCSSLTSSRLQQAVKFKNTNSATWVSNCWMNVAKEESYSSLYCFFFNFRGCDTKFLIEFCVLIFYSPVV